MKKVNAGIFVIALLVVCGQTAQSTAEEQTVDIWTAAAQGNLEAVKQHIAAGTEILGPTTEKEPSRDLNIVWVWGIDKLHEKGTHEYAWVMDDYVNELLHQIPRVTVAASMYFLKKELWEKADLVVFYLWPREEWDYDLIGAYKKRGGGV